MISKFWSMIDIDGKELAQINVDSCEEGWFHGTTISHDFSKDLQSALRWYDEVVSGQMLSFLDEAQDAVARFQLRLRLPDGQCEKVYSIQLSTNGEARFAHRLCRLGEKSENWRS
jgi:hypothetical protein